MRGLWSMIIGAVGVVGGASGQLVLRGTNSRLGLIIVGALAFLFGAYQLVTDRMKKKAVAVEATVKDESE